MKEFDMLQNQINEICKRIEALEKNQVKGARNRNEIIGKIAELKEEINILYNFVHENVVIEKLKNK